MISVPKCRRSLRERKKHLTPKVSPEVLNEDASIMKFEDDEANKPSYDESEKAEGSASVANAVDVQCGRDEEGALHVEIHHGHHGCIEDQNAVADAISPPPYVDRIRTGCSMKTVPS